MSKQRNIASWSERIEKMEQKDMYYNKAEYIETVSITNYQYNSVIGEYFEIQFRIWFNIDNVELLTNIPFE